MTEVSGPGSSGEIAKIALLFLGTAGPQGSEGARGTAIALAGRHHRSRGGFGNGAVHAARGAAFRRSLLLNSANTARIGGTRCASWVG